MTNFAISPYILSVVSVVFFCVCCHFLIRAILAPVPRPIHASFTQVALRLQKSYSVASWGIMTLVFLGGLVVSFSQVYTSMP